MKFSEYTITAKTEQSLDVLGFSSPFLALRSSLYPQFTVLCNSPLYHGVLALVYRTLSRRPVKKSAVQGFAHRFREAEALWGLSVVAAQGTVLNVTKYQAALQGREIMALSSIGKGNTIFRSLAYGTLGHYGNPSVLWRFLERGATKLTGLGEELAVALDQRKGGELSRAMAAWLDGASFDQETLMALGKTYNLDAQSGKEEREVWRKTIDAWCKGAPITDTLWQTQLPPERLAQLRSNAESYKDFFVYLRENYPTLKATLTHAEHFEAISAVCRFLFDGEYLRQHQAGNQVAYANGVEIELATSLVSMADAYLKLNPRAEPRGLFTQLAAADGHGEVCGKIVAHHVANQKAKGALPYIEDGRLRVRDRVDRQAYAGLYERLETLDREQHVGMLAYHYRRDWHVDRAQGYLRYMWGTA